MGKEDADLIPWVSAGAGRLWLAPGAGAGHDPWGCPMAGAPCPCPHVALWTAGEAHVGSHGEGTFCQERGGSTVEITCSWGACVELETCNIG